MRLLLATLIVLVVLIAAAGVIHRSSCVNANRTGCSVLPWKDGHKPYKPETELQRLQKKYGLSH